MKNKLIYDLGFHKGEDSAYYMEKGYRVIAVEANPSLVEIAYKQFASEIISGQLTLLNRVILNDLIPVERKDISFYIHPERTEWSSIYREIAEQDGQKSNEVRVKSIGLFTMFEHFGVPEFMKVDIEGADVGVAYLLCHTDKKPKYVSFELNGKDYAEIFMYLKSAGYKLFQLRNQANNKNGSSGEFGEFLPEDKWITFDEALSRYIKFKELRKLDYENLSFGWLDIVAKRV